MKCYIMEQKDLLLAEGYDIDQLVSAVRPSLFGEAILNRFCKIALEADKAYKLSGKPQAAEHIRYVKKQRQKEIEMKEMIAFCGLTCHDCGALLATQNDDDTKRAQVAQQWSELFKVDIKPESINCHGCLSEGGQLFSYCEVCEIRKCAMEKDVMNCAYCNEYACEKLNKFFHMAPDAKKRLDEIRSNL